MRNIDCINNAHSQYYEEYLLSRILERANYKLDTIEMVKESYFVEDDTYDFLVAKITAVDKADGRVSYPKIYPRFFTSDDFDDFFLGKCDDLVVRFSIFFDKTGFFSPLWTRLYKDGKEFKSSGVAMDWDKYSNPASRMSRTRYRLLEQQAKNSTSQQNDEVVLRTIPIWLQRAAIIYEE